MLSLCKEHPLVVGGCVATCLYCVWKAGLLETLFAAASTRRATASEFDSIRHVLQEKLELPQTAGEICTFFFVVFSEKKNQPPNKQTTRHAGCVLVAVLSHASRCSHTPPHCCRYVSGNGTALLCTGHPESATQGHEFDYETFDGSPDTIDDMCASVCTRENIAAPQ